MGIAEPAGDGVGGFAVTSRLVHAGKESASADLGCAFSMPAGFPQRAEDNWDLSQMDDGVADRTSAR